MKNQEKFVNVSASALQGSVFCYEILLNRLLFGDLKIFI